MSTTVFSKRSAAGRHLAHPVFTAAMLLVSVLLATWPGAAAAAAAAGRVVAVMGTVEASGGERGAVRLARGSEVFAGETLASALRSRAQFRFTDGSRLTLNSDSTMVVDAYEYDAAAPSTARQQFRVPGALRASFSMHTGEIGKRAVANAGTGDGFDESIYSVRTPLAVIGVRGTDWNALQEPGGPLTLGVVEDDTRGVLAFLASGSGRRGSLGSSKDFRFARIGVSGDVDFLLVPPENLGDAPGVDEPGDPGESSEPDAEPGGAPVAGDTPDTTGGANTTLQLVNVSTNPEESGTFTPPIPDAVPGLTTAEQAALLNGNQVGLITGLPIPTLIENNGSTQIDSGGVSDVAPGPLASPFALDPLGTPPLVTASGDREVIQSGVQTEGGLAALDANGAPIFAFFGGAGFSPGFEPGYDPVNGRADELGVADTFVSPRSGLFTLQQDVGGIDGLTWGSYAPPVSVIGDIDNGNLAIDSNRELLFVIGQPSGMSPTTGFLDFYVSGAEVLAANADIDFFDVTAELNVGSGGVGGILDLALFDASSEDFFVYETDWSGQVQNGVINAAFSNINFFRDDVSGGGPSFPAFGSIGGFFTGEDGQVLQLAFDLSSPSVPAVDVLGLARLTNYRLLPSEATAVAAGPVFIGAACCSAESFGSPTLLYGLAAVSSSGDFQLLGFNGEESPEPLSSSLFLSQPPEFIVRNGGVVESTTPSVSGTGLQSVRGSIWAAQPTGSEGPVDPGKIGIFYAEDGFPLFQTDERLLLAAAEPTTATLTGQFEYASAALINGYEYSLASSGPAPIGTPLNPTGFDFGFNVDFGTGGVTDGYLFVPTASGQAFDLLFMGTVTNTGGLTALETTSSGGVFGGQDPLRTTEAPLTGFFTGTSGEGFVGAFALSALNSNENAAAGTFTAQQQAPVVSGALTPAELALMQDGYYFIGVDCCFVPGGVSGGVANGVFGGPAIDPALSNGQDTVFSASFGGATGELADPSEPQFGTIPGDFILRRAGASAGFTNDYESLPGTETLSSLEWFADLGSVGVLDPETGGTLNEYNGILFFATAVPTSFAALTGSARYELFSIENDVWMNLSGTLEPSSLFNFDMNFNVDLVEGTVLSGLITANTANATNGFRASLGGQVVNMDGVAFAEFDIVQGTYVGVPTAGTGIDFGNSSAGGFFTGANGEIFAGAFQLVSNGGDPIMVAGTTTLSQVDLALTAAEAAEMNSGAGLWFIGADCCVDGGTGYGQVTNPAPTSGDAVLGLAIDPATGELVLPDSINFFDDPSEIVRRAGAAITTYNPTAPVTSAGGGTIVSWDGRLTPPVVVDPVSGALLDRTDDELLFITAMPSLTSSLNGFATFGGDSAGGSLGGAKLGGTAPGATASFNVDFATGAVSNGQLFNTTFSSGTEDFGFNVFFEGQLGNDNSFVGVTLLDGVYDETQTIDLFLSEVDGFFSGSSGEFFHGSYYLVSADSGDTQAGVFSIGGGAATDARLTSTDVADWGQRTGIAAINTLTPFDTPGGLPGSLTTGLLVGRGGDPAQGNPFTLGANNWRDTNGAQTARQGFWTQPFDALLSQGAATLNTGALDGDVIVNSTSYANDGFNVSWGAWNAGPGSGARVQDNPANATNGVNLETNVYFASVVATPNASLPASGTLSYNGNLSLGSAAVIGEGTGNLSLAFGAPIDAFDIGFDVDFGSGGISNGSVAVGYSGSGNALWQGTFSGFANGAVLDLELNTLTIEDGFGSTLGSGNLAESAIGGVLTGPAGERAVGGFSFSGDDGLSSFESVRGVFAVDQGLPVLP